MLLKYRMLRTFLGVVLILCINKSLFSQTIEFQFGNTVDIEFENSYRNPVLTKLVNPSRIELDFLHIEIIHKILSQGKLKIYKDKNLELVEILKCGRNVQGKHPLNELEPWNGETLMFRFNTGLEWSEEKHQLGFSPVSIGLIRSLKEKEEEAFWIPAYTDPELLLTNDSVTWGMNIHTSRLIKDEKTISLLKFLIKKWEEKEINLYDGLSIPYDSENSMKQSLRNRLLMIQDEKMELFFTVNIYFNSLKNNIIINLEQLIFHFENDSYPLNRVIYKVE